MPLSRKDVVSNIGEDINGLPTWKNDEWPGSSNTTPSHVGEDSEGNPTWKGNAWPGSNNIDEELLNRIGEDHQGNPTWDGSVWPGISAHTDLINQNDNSEYLHVTEAEKTQYDGYENIIANLLARVYELETGSAPTPVVLGVPNIHGDVDIELFNEIYIDFPMTEHAGDVEYDIRLNNIITTPNNIITSDITIVNIEEDLFLRVPVTPTAYNTSHTITIKKDTIMFNGVGNTSAVSATFTTSAAEEIIITNSSLHEQTDVPVNTDVVVYALTNNSPNSNITINADNISVSGATFYNVAIENNDTLKVYLSNVNYSTSIIVTIGVGTVLNSGTPNSTSVVTEFTIETEYVPPVEPEMDVPSTDGATNIPANSTVNVDVPIVVSDDVEYTINTENITIEPDDILDGTVEIIVDTNGNKFLRIPVTPTEYNEEYTITVGENTLVYDGVGNTDTIITTFTTAPAEVPIIQNSNMNNATNVSLDDLVLEFDLLRTDENTTLTIANTNAITATNATIDNIEIIDSVLYVHLTDLTYNTAVEVIVGTGAIDNSGTLNTAPITTTFTTMEDPESGGEEPGEGEESPYEWEYTYHLGFGLFEINIDADIDNSFDKEFTLEDFYGPAYDGVDKTVEVLWLGYDGNIMYPEGSPMATTIETWEHESPDGKVDYNGMKTITFAGGSASTRVYKLVKHKTPITRS